MAIHFSDIGFDFKNEEELYPFLDWAFERAEIYELPMGRAALYQPEPDGLQFWFPVDEEGNALDWNFHFESGQVNDIQVLECLAPERGGMSGLYRCEIEIDDGAGQPIPEVPCNLYLPAVGLMGSLVSGAWYKAQIACFAEGLAVYTSEKALLDSREPGESGFAPEHFIPSGTFSPDLDPDFEQAPRALLGGTVLSSRRMKNPVTGLSYDHLQITSLGMRYDVLCDPALYDTLPQPGHVLHGQFWLSALVWSDKGI